jgi:hypothetical protein
MHRNHSVYKGQQYGHIIFLGIAKMSCDVNHFGFRIHTNKEIDNPMTIYIQSKIHCN